MGAVLLFGGLFVLVGSRGDGQPAQERATEPPSLLHALGPRLRALRGASDPSTFIESMALSTVDRAMRETPTQERSACVLAAMRDADVDVRWAGVLAMAHYGPADDALVAALRPIVADEEHPLAQRTAIGALEYLPEQARGTFLPVLRRASRSPRGDVQARALRTLASLAARRPELLDRFAEALTHPAPEVREVGAYGLAQIEQPEASAPASAQRVVEALARALRDERDAVRSYAAMALSRRGAAAELAIPALIGALSDTSRAVQGNAAMALGNMGEVALPALEARLAEDEGERVAMLIWSIGLMGETGVPVLERAMVNGAPLVRVFAALKRWEIDRHVDALLPHLEQALASEDPRAWLQAARGVGRVGAAAKELAPALERVRRRAAEAGELQSALVAALQAATRVLDRGE